MTPRTTALRRLVLVTLGTIVTAATLLSMGGCSVVMAASTTGDRAQGVLASGTTRQEVEKSLGSPRSSRPGPAGGRTDRYAYRRPDPTGGFRAFENGFMDVITVGFWEAAATPYEIAVGAHPPMSVAVVEYDAQDCIVSWWIEDEPRCGGAAAPTPEAAQGRCTKGTASGP